MRVDGGQDEGVDAIFLMLCEGATREMLGEPVGAAGFVVAGAGIVDHVVGPERQLHGQWIVGQVTVVVQPLQAGGHVIQGVVVAMGFTVEGGQLLPDGIWLAQ